MTRIVGASAAVFTSRCTAGSSSGSSTRRSDDSRVTMPCHRPRSSAVLSAFGGSVKAHTRLQAATTVQSATGPRGRPLQTAARAAKRLVWGEQAKKTSDTEAARTVAAKKFSADIWDRDCLSPRCADSFAQSIREAASDLQPDSAPIAFMLNGASSNKVAYWMLLVMCADSQGEIKCWLFDPSPQGLTSAQRTRMPELVRQGLHKANLAFNKRKDVYTLPWNQLELEKYGDTTFPLCAEFGNALKGTKPRDIQNLFVSWTKKGPQQLKDACERGAKHFRAI